MRAIKDIAQLGKLIATQHGWAAAKAFKNYQLTEADQGALSRCAVDLLKVFPAVSGVVPQISAALAVGLERYIQAPIHVVAGTLAVEGVPVLGDRQPFVGAQVFSTSSPDWNGHVWVMIGPYVIDIAIFRIAYSAQGPSLLAKHVDLVFGPGKGLYVDHWKKTRQQGLEYEPHYVLSEDEVNRLMGGAFQMIKQGQPASSK